MSTGVIVLEEMNSIMCCLIIYHLQIQGLRLEVKCMDVVGVCVCVCGYVGWG